MTAVRAARTAAWIYAGIIAFQLAVALGAPWGQFTQGGQHPGTLPASMRGVAAASAFIIACLAMTVLAAVELGPLRTASARTRLWAMRATTAYAGVAVAVNIATRSSAERTVWAPVSIVLLVLCVRVLQGMKPAH